MSAELVTVIKAEIAKLRGELAVDPRTVKLEELERVLRLYEASEQTKGAAETARPERARKATSPARQAALDAARIYLKERQGPVKTAELFEHITKHLGLEIGGENPQNNLSAMLSNSEEFNSHGRAGWTWEKPIQKDEGVFE